MSVTVRRVKDPVGDETVGPEGVGCERVIVWLKEGLLVGEYDMLLVPVGLGGGLGVPVRVGVGGGVGVPDPVWVRLGGDGVSDAVAFQVQEGGEADGEDVPVSVVLKVGVNKPVMVVEQVGVKDGDTRSVAVQLRLRVRVRLSLALMLNEALGEKIDGVGVKLCVGESVGEGAGLREGVALSLDQDQLGSWLPVGVLLQDVKVSVTDPRVSVP